MDNNLQFARPFFALGAGLFVALSIYLVKLSVGLPVRTLVLLSLFSAFATLFRVHWPTLLDNFHLRALAAMGLFGLVASLIFEFELAGPGYQMFRFIIQPGVVLITGLMLCQLLGVRFLSQLFLAAILVSATVAVLQGLNLQPAWDLANKLAVLQGMERSDIFVSENTSGGGVYIDRFRPRGLSYSNIHLGYQACLCFMMFYLSRMLPTRFADLFPRNNLLAFAILAWLLVAVFMTGTRSSLYGLLLLWPAHLFFTSRQKIPIVLLGLAILMMVPVIQPILYEVLDVRVLSIEDSSFAARKPLAMVGLLLFLDMPIGHGWLADTTELQAEYWHMLYQMENARAVAGRDLHNNPIRLLFVYGIGAIVTLTWYFLKLKAHYSKYLLIGLVPYLAHSTFHNDGLFLGGNYIWLVFAMIHACYLLDNQRSPAPAPTAQTVRPIPYLAVKS
ncbi:O-antigen ligase family protein [Ferrimonas marina]|uniref:O-Antigen ligase n=1 Tax=Ferrimonas marina TaxID=299255 RepID=A0A1M5ZQP4_9GAMM|nr:O-antigen ligase family protein [Ferrimonas marina]SHI26524.1 O-Antigen ligase [Ferrimonas marina]